MPNELKPFSVKKLVWTRDGSRHAGRAGEFRRYIKIGWRLDKPFEFGFDCYATLDEAKAVAEADYERRILSAIEPAPAAPYGWHYRWLPADRECWHFTRDAEHINGILKNPHRSAAYEVIPLYRSAPAPAPPSDDGWQPIETAPKDGTRILAVESFQREDEDGRLYPEDAAVVRWVTSRHDGHSGWSGYGLFLASFEPTHWRPLHAPPKGDAP